MNVAILLLSAGSGQRFGGTIPKQYVDVQGQALVAYTLQSLAAESRIKYVQPVIADGDDLYVTLTQGLALPFEHAKPVVGGHARAISMAKGLASLPKDIDLVAVHDAARPLPSVDLLKDVLDVAITFGSAVPGIDVYDTMKRVDAHGLVLETLDRSSLRAVQTPQVARREWLEQAITHVGNDLELYTDDVSLLEAAGFPVHISRGNILNRKVTTRDDLEWLEEQVKMRGRECE